MPLEETAGWPSSALMLAVYTIVGPAAENGWGRGRHARSRRGLARVGAPLGPFSRHKAPRDRRALGAAARGERLESTRAP